MAVGDGLGEGVAVGDELAVGVAVGDALGVVVAVGLGVGVLTTTATVGQPKGTVGREILGVGEALGEAWA